MKKIKTLTNSFVLQDVDSSGKIIHQQGYKKGGLTYRIENGNIKFYLYQDYFYKNVVWSADLPLQVDGVYYDANTIADGIKKIFKFETDPADTEFDEKSQRAISNAAVTNKFNAIDATISGLKKKDEQLTTDVYTKSETDDKLALKADKSEIPSLTGYATEEWVNNQNYLTQHQDLSNYATKADLNKKQDKGDYALKTEIPTVPTKVSAFQNDKGYLTEHQDLSGYALKTDIPTVPSKISAFQNDAGYLTEHQDLSTYATKADLDNKQDKGNYALKTDIPVVPSKVSAFENDKGYLTEHQDLSNYATKDELADKQDKGNYALKTDIPVVPSKVSAFENDKGYLTEHQDISGLATKTELNGKQDALVSGTNLKTINGQTLLGNGDIAINGGSGLKKWEGTRAEYNALSSYDADTLYVITDEDVEIPVVPTKVSAFENDAGYLTQHQDISNLATKTELNGKQDKLVSGTNVKTINGQSLLGSGDIATVPVTTDNVNYTNSSSTKTLTQVLNNTEEITFTLEDGSTVTKKFILG